MSTVTSASSEMALLNKTALGLLNCSLFVAFLAPQSAVSFHLPPTFLRAFQFGIWAIFLDDSRSTALLRIGPITCACVIE